MGLFVCWFYPYCSRLLHWHWGNRKIAAVPVKQPWRISACQDSSKNVIITTTKESITNLCTFYGIYCIYGTGSGWVIWMHSFIEYDLSVFRCKIVKSTTSYCKSLIWCHMSDSSDWQLGCLFNSLFRLTTKKIAKLPELLAHQWLVACRGQPYATNRLIFDIFTKQKVEIYVRIVQI